MGLAFETWVSLSFDVQTVLQTPEFPKSPIHGHNAALEDG